MTLRRRQINILLALLGALALLLMAGMMALQVVQVQSIEETVSDGRTMGEWDVYQLQVEQLKLGSEIDATLRGGGQGDAMSRLKLRYGIFASRYEIVRDGLSRRLIGDLPSYREMVAALSRFADYADHYFGPDDQLPAFQKASLDALKLELERIAPPIQKVMLDSTHARHRVNHAYLAAVRAQVKTAWAISLALLLVASAFGLLALRQMRLAVRRNEALEQLHAEVSHRAAHDVLTGLINRDEFERKLDATLVLGDAMRERHAVLFIDLDRFKIVNDSCGHGAGDQLLREAAALIRGAVRTSDVVARIGGDEFAVILSHCDQTSARQLAERICLTIDDYRFVQSGQSFHIGASIGLVMLNEQLGSVSAVLQAADSACYVAKESGRNRVYVYMDSDQGVQAQRGVTNWVQRVHSALDESRMHLYWQRIVPICAPDDGHLRCEVLLRMTEGDHLIEPGAFLPVAERYALATRIDRWVITALFEWLTTHAGQVAHVDAISINLSGQSVSDPEFQQLLIDRLQVLAFDRRKLCFEVTETAAITKLRQSIVFFERLRALGARVSLDDFGSGMSSFGYLKSLPVDILKIDGQFMRHLAHDNYDQATVRAICDVARATGKRTVAEGIETAAVAQRLRSFGVDFGQGFLWHVPEPLATMLALLPTTPRSIHNVG